MMGEPKLPKQIYVKWGYDEPWLMAYEKEDDIASQDEAIIGVYELKETHAVKLVTSIRKITKKVK
jgi:hypothetical protein